MLKNQVYTAKVLKIVPEYWCCSEACGVLQNDFNILTSGCDSENLTLSEWLQEQH